MTPPRLQGVRSYEPGGGPARPLLDGTSRQARSEGQLWYSRRGSTSRASWRARLGRPHVGEVSRSGEHALRPSCEVATCRQDSMATDPLSGSTKHRSPRSRMMERRLASGRPAARSRPTRRSGQRTCLIAGDRRYAAVTSYVSSAHRADCGSVDRLGRLRRRVEHSTDHETAHGGLYERPAPRRLRSAGGSSGSPPAPRRQRGGAMTRPSRARRNLARCTRWWRSPWASDCAARSRRPV